MNQRTEEFFGEDMLHGEYYHAVTGVPASPMTLRIMYMPAYFYDRGTNLPSDDWHSGDSEFIAVDVAFSGTTGRWHTQQVHLSQHGDWRAFHWTAFRYDNYVSQGAPLIHVADLKHSNYPSDEACDDGATHTDNCSGTRVWVRFPVSFDFNIGSFHRQIGAVPVRRPHSAGMFDPTKFENLWSPWGFNGWQSNPDGSPGYGPKLDFYGFGGSSGQPTPGEDCPSDPTAIYCPEP